jgi:hypothetical protein
VPPRGLTDASDDRRGMNDSIDTRLVDEAVDAYVGWREECPAVRADRTQRCALAA